MLEFAILYSMIGVAWFSWTEWGVKNLKNWHYLISVTIFLPMTLFLLCAFAASVGFKKISSWLMEDI